MYVILHYFIKYPLILLFPKQLLALFPGAV